MKEIYTAFIHFAIALLVLLFTKPVIGQLPKIVSFTPNSATSNRPVTITGANLNEVNAVSFGGIPAFAFFINSATSILAYVGEGSSGYIKVSNANGADSLPGFTFLPTPKVTSFNPTTGGLGTLVNIKGAYLNDITQVSFGQFLASSFTITSDTTIAAIVGVGSSGYVSVRSANGAAGGLPGFIHTRPVVSSYTPTAGTAGGIVTLKGGNFTGATNVSIGAIPATSFTVVSATEITAVIPANASGRIEVTTPQGSGSIDGFNQATIKNVTPSYGTIGSIITLNGFNFTGTTSVNFGTVPAASFNVVGDTIINATIAEGGYGDLTVATASYGNASTYFSFYWPIPQIISYSPNIGGPGTIVVIKGRYFKGTTEVSFGGTPVSSFAVSSDSVLTVVLGSGSSGDINIKNAYGNNNGGPSSGGFIFTTLPTITYFSPTKGPIETIVTLNGVNFGNTTSDNIVYLGAAKAEILSASSTSLRIKVPTGAGHSPFILSANNLTASTQKPFLITFPADTTFGANLFAKSPEIQFNGFIWGTAAGDFDGDGKPDVAVASGDSMAVFRNIGSGAKVSFAPYIKFYTGSSGRLLTADMDGDGKLDIISSWTGGAFVLKNMSTIGNISFSSPNTAYPYDSPIRGVDDIAIADFDNDGKLDIVAVASSFDNGAIVFKNASTSEKMLFVVTKMYSRFLAPFTVITTDLDRDGRMDFVMASKSDPNTPEGIVSIFRNTTSGGKINFDIIHKYLSKSIVGLTSSDFDSDSQPDIAILTANQLNILKNTSYPDNILLDTTFSLATEGNSLYTLLEIADLNGDAKPDIVASNGTIYKNGSSTSTILFGPVVKFSESGSFCINDMDRNGKPDIIQSLYFDTTFSVWQNNIGPNILYLCPTYGNSSLISNLIGSTYKWQVDKGTGFTNIVDNSNYTGSQTEALQLISIPSEWYGYKFRCLINGNSFSAVTEIKFRNFWTGSSNTSWEDPANWSCGALPDNNTDVVINNGTVVLNSNTTVRTLKLDPSVHMTVKAGNKLTILQK